MDVKSHEADSTVMRRLGALEQLYWFYDRATPFHFVMAAEVEGKTQAGDWREALDRFQQRYPLLTAAVRQGLGKGLYFARDGQARIPLRVVAGENVLGWEREAAVEMSVRFRPGDAPLLRATVILRPESAVIMLAVHHAIADGVSIAHALEDLLQLVLRTG